MGSSSVDYAHPGLPRTARRLRGSPGAGTRLRRSAEALVPPPSLECRRDGRPRPGRPRPGPPLPPRTRNRGMGRDGPRSGGARAAPKGPWAGPDLAGATPRSWGARARLRHRPDHALKRSLPRPRPLTCLRSATRTRVWTPPAAAHIGTEFPFPGAHLSPVLHPPGMDPTSERPVLRRTTSLPAKSPTDASPTRL